MSEDRTGSKDFQLFVKRGRTYGGEYIEFGISTVATLRSGAERRAELASLAAQVEDQIKVWEDTMLPRLNLAKDNFVGKNEPQNSIITVPVQAIRISNESGERRYRVCGGQFMKHGVPLYDDALANCPFDLTQLDYGEHHFGGEYDAVVEMAGNKPKRIRRIEKL
jgi:hypothetical protein